MAGPSADQRIEDVAVGLPDACDDHHVRVADRVGQAQA
jgi:hypothetical protein